MPALLPYFVAPVLGGVIGYITNEVAIRMLFRPHQAKYIMGWHVPFTPGLIPKERERIAASVGDTISRNLMNSEVLERTLLGDDITSRIGQAIDRYFDSLKQNPESLRDYLSHFTSDDEIDALTTSSNEELTRLIHHKLTDEAIGRQIAHVAVDHVMKKMSGFGHQLGDALAEEGIGHGGGIGDAIKRTIGRLFGKSGQDNVSNFIDALAMPVEKALAKNINEMLKNNSGQIVGDLITTEVDKLLSRSMSDLVSGKDEQLEHLKSSLLKLYHRLVTTQLPRALEAIDISHMVQTRLAEMDVPQLEQLILGVMKRELRAIVWLGALLGTLMGYINVLFF